MTNKIDSRELQYIEELSEYQNTMFINVNTREYIQERFNHDQNMYYFYVLDNDLKEMKYLGKSKYYIHEDYIIKLED